MVAGFAIVGHPSGIQGGFSSTKEFRDLFFDLGCDSMPMNFPIRPHVAQKPFPFCKRKRFPNVLCHGAKRVDDRTPIAIRSRCRPDLISYQPHESASGSRALVIPVLRPFATLTMRLWHQAVPGKNVNVPGESF